MSESFAELFEESLKTLNLQPGAIITGIVVDIDGDWVTVHAGLKSEGVIPLEQFYNEAGELTIKVGDEVHVALDAVEDGFGETKLSREKAKRAECWIVLEAAFAAEEVVKGVINGKVKGGFTVDVNGIRAFLPGSLVDVRPVRDNSRSSSWTRSATTLSFPVAVSWKPRTPPSAKLCWNPCRKVSKSRVSSRTSPITAHSSIWVASMACCTSPTWPGSVSSTHRKSSTLATRSMSRF